MMRHEIEDIIDITNRLIELQKNKRDEENKGYESKRNSEDGLTKWWIVEVLLIVILGLLQWNRMKNKLQTAQNDY